MPGSMFRLPHLHSPYYHVVHICRHLMKRLHMRPKSIKVLCSCVLRQPLTLNIRAVALPSRSNIQRTRGILSIPEASRAEETVNEASDSLDVDACVFAITDQSSRAIKQVYCFACWKQGQFALDCPLIYERDRKT
jgi:hypothetical protein